MSEWQDISTAPKDGTLIDLWAKSYDIASRDSDEMTVIVEFRVADAQWFAGDWADENGNGLWCHDWQNLRFTHWMPHPSPPEAK